jgi:hypothetical protein
MNAINAFNIKNLSGTFCATVWAFSVCDAVKIATKLGAHKNSKFLVRQQNSHTPKWVVNLNK